MPALKKLIELKLASGLSATHRMRDLADVQDLIVALNLPLKLMDKLDKRAYCSASLSINGLVMTVDFPASHRCLRPRTPTGSSLFNAL